MSNEKCFCHLSDKAGNEYAVKDATAREAIKNHDAHISSIVIDIETLQDESKSNTALIGNNASDIANLIANKMNKPSPDILYDKVPIIKTSSSGGSESSLALTNSNTGAIGDDGKHTISIPIRQANGNITVALTPSAITDATSKKYVDDTVKSIEDKIAEHMSFYPIYQHRVSINCTYDLNGVSIVAKFLSTDKTPIDTLALCATNREKILGNMTEFGCWYSYDGMGNDEYTLDDILVDPADDLPEIYFYEDGLTLVALTTETVNMNFRGAITEVADTITEV